MTIPIIGGGITGLTTALALKKIGVSSKVYEKTPAFEPIGAGIMLQPNALKILSWLGLKEAVEAAGVKLQLAQIADKNLIPFRTNSTIADLNNHMVSIHRHALHQVLLEALPENSILNDSPYRSHKYTKKGVELQIGNTSITTPFFLAADGIHSKVRQALFPDAQLRYSGQTCWRGIAEYTLPELLNTIGQENWANGIRFGFVPIAPSKIYWFAVAKAKKGEVDPPGKIKQSLQDKFGKVFASPVSDLIDSTPKIIRNDISDLKRLKTWHSARVLLLGDAAHATTPNMGQGGCQGIEDAFYFAQLFNHDKQSDTVFKEFENSRRKKTDFIVNSSWQMGKMAHSTIGQFMLKTALQYMPKSLVQNQLHKTFYVSGL